MQYTYRYFKASWGIYIELDYEIIFNYFVDQAYYGDEIKHIYNDVYMKIKNPSTEYEFISYIQKALIDVSELLKNTISSPVLFEIEKITYNWCDFQKEAIYAAVVCVFLNYFKLDTALQPKIEFDPIRRKYMCYDLKNHLLT